MTNKRKHIRVSYEKKVSLVSEGEAFAGKSIDISKNGMQVIVNTPLSHLTMQYVTFHLPTAAQPLEIPCKIVHIREDHAKNGNHILGIEFTYETEAQMMLIDNFVRDMRSRQLINEMSTDEMRGIPRISCCIADVETDMDGANIISIDNISTEGCLVSFTGSLSARDEIQMAIDLPGGKRVTVTGAVSYVINNYFQQTSRAGICFARIDEIDRTRIHNFIVQSSSSYSMRKIQEKIAGIEIDNGHQIHDSHKIREILHLMRDASVKINVLLEDHTEIYQFTIAEICAGESAFTLLSPEDLTRLNKPLYRLAYCSFYHGASTYYFKCEVLGITATRVDCTLPSSIFQSEKRSCERKFLSGGFEIFIETEGASSGMVRGSLVNISSRGFLCNVTLKSADTEAFQSGKPLFYSIDKDLGIEDFGEIRHLNEETALDGSTVLQIGVEAGIRRADFRSERFEESAWSQERLYRGALPESFRERINSDVVRYRNDSGQEIVGFVNSTGPVTAAPVVILPPAFGKKKEALSPLVATIISNFRQLNKEIITLRYDGINRPGESYNEEMCPKRGYEMLHYNISQGLDDLGSTVDYVYDNPRFKPTAVIIIAFSMSSLDARKLLVEDNKGRIDYLINVMGVTCAQSSFRNITGGIDIIGNFRSGIQNGMAGVLGHLLNLDVIARDLIENKYAYLTDARFDMSQVPVPVTWIYGKYDRWIDEEEIHDIMSVDAEGMREVIEIPTGHNLRSSDDALKTFRIVTGLIHRHLAGSEIRVLEPDREVMVSLVTDERERLIHPGDIDMVEYWKDYLIGDSEGAGYDFYRNIDEFREFLSMEGKLLDLKDGEVMADMGCGTGLFMETMLADMAESRADVSGSRIILTDLVEEALQRARSKYENLKQIYGRVIPDNVHFNQMDLESSRLIPVKRFVDDRNLDLQYLRCRVEGMKGKTIDRLSEKASGLLYDILRGSPLSDEAHLYLNENFSEQDCRVIIEFNRAARFVTGSLTPDDLRDESPFACRQHRPEDCRKLKASDLRFSELNFGEGGLDFTLPFDDCSLDKIAASLLVSYLFNPDEIVIEFKRLLKPGGKLLLSSMKPDSDISMIFTNYIEMIKGAEPEDSMQDRDLCIADARSMLNEAASLFELEEDGYFRFYSGDELAAMMRRAGFQNIMITPSMGNPPQAVIVTGFRRRDEDL